jgi:hypothetical protein
VTGAILPAGGVAHVIAGNPINTKITRAGIISALDRSTVEFHRVAGRQRHVQIIQHFR